MSKTKDLALEIALMLILIINLSFSLIFAGDSEVRQNVTRAKQSVFKLKFTDGTYIGSGFMINTLGNMLTCAHVVDSSKTLSGKYVQKLLAENFLNLERDSTHVDTDVVTYDVAVDTVIPSLDFAVLTVDLKNPNFKEIKDSNLYIARPVYLGFANTEKIWEGQDVISCAYIKDDFSIPKPIIAKGVVSTIRNECYDLRMRNRVDILQLDLNISKGNSGAPVFLLDDGRVIGIIDAGIFGDSSPWQTGYAIAITTNQILDKLRELKIPFDFR